MLQMFQITYNSSQLHAADVFPHVFVHRYVTYLMAKEGVDSSRSRGAPEPSRWGQVGQRRGPRRGQTAAAEAWADCGMCGEWKRQRGG